MEDIILIIVLYIIGTLVADQADRKKRKKKKKHYDVDTPPASRETPLDFEIPTLKRDNDFENNFDVHETKSESDSNKYQEYLNESKDSPLKSLETPIIVRETPKLETSLSRETVREGIILAEILGRPLAKRRLRRF